jgi:PPOX class probable F420-dependent enzyme
MNALILLSLKGPTMIPAEYLDLLEKPTFPTLVTLMPDGQPQASVVWFSYDGQHILVNTARGRQKDKNMTARPQVTLLFVDLQNPYRFLEVRGKVVSSTEEGGVAHINALSERYTGNPDFFKDDEKRRQTERRVIYRIEPVRVVGH